MLILEENFTWHLEAFASELFIYNLLNNKKILNLFTIFIGDVLTWSISYNIKYRREIII